ncbi:hypothetical protein D9M70_599620 [compost metagenome]
MPFLFGQGEGLCQFHYRTGARTVVIGSVIDLPFLIYPYMIIVRRDHDHLIFPVGTLQEAHHIGGLHRFIYSF